MLLHMLIAVAAPNDARFNNADTAAPIIYKIDSQTAPSVTKTFYFFEEKQKFGAAPGSEGGVDISDYSQNIVDNVVLLGFAGTSVPYDISAGKKWQEGLNSCSADPISSDGKRLLAVCGPRSKQAVTSSVYTYEKGRGVTLFHRQNLLVRTAVAQGPPSDASTACALARSRASTRCDAATVRALRLRSSASTAAAMPIQAVG
jgi:hypothetical protein